MSDIAELAVVTAVLNKFYSREPSMSPRIIPKVVTYDTTKTAAVTFEIFLGSTPMSTSSTTTVYISAEDADWYRERIGKAIAHVHEDT